MGCGFGLTLVLMFAYISCKKLPYDSNLETVLRGNSTYVDKTGFVLKLLNGTDRYVFVARPPRFGKSFFVDTLRLIFEGVENKELFRNTEIYRSDYEWRKYHVLYFDFDALSSRTGKFEDLLLRQIVDMENRLNIRPRLSSFTTELGNLVQQIDLGGLEEVVFLVDNYDVPVTRFLVDNPPVAAENMNILREFLVCLESLDVFSRLTFVTGVSRFPMNKKWMGTKLFVDLTLREEYAAVMGFTQDELDAYFEEYVNTNHEMKNALLEKYFGYRFSNETQFLYQPHSVVQHFARNTSDNDPTSAKSAKHVLTELKKRPHVLFALQNITDAKLLLNDVNRLDRVDTMIASLFQTGYLTIKRCKLIGKKRCYDYELGFATPAVEDYVLDTLLEEILSQENITSGSEFSEIRRYFIERELTAFVDAINVYLQRAAHGRNYGKLIECLLRLAGVKAIWRPRIELISSNEMRVDCVFELSMDRHNASEALHSLVSRDRGELIRPSEAKLDEVLAVGMNVNSESRTIDACEAVLFDKNGQKMKYFSAVKKN